MCGKRSAHFLAENIAAYFAIDHSYIISIKIHSLSISQGCNHLSKRIILSSICEQDKNFKFSKNQQLLIPLFALPSINQFNHVSQMKKKVNEWAISLNAFL